MNILLEPRGDDQIDVAVYGGIDPLAEDPDVGELGPLVVRLVVSRIPNPSPFAFQEETQAFQATLCGPSFEPVNLEIAVPRFRDSVIREVEA